MRNDLSDQPIHNGLTIMRNGMTAHIATPPEGQAFVASNEFVSGALEAFQICRNLRAEGKSGGETAI